MEECSFFSQGSYPSHIRKIKQHSQGIIYLKCKIKFQTVIETNEKSKVDSKTKKSKITTKSTISKLSKRTQNVRIKEFADYPFKIFDKKFLDYFGNVPELKCRVYILRCLNLSAQSNHVDTAHLLAGLEGKCSANAYPEIMVGNGESLGENIKVVVDSTRSIPSDLNPKFFRMYELDAQLPSDWKLVVSIWNKEVIKDSLIGSVQIDLEDRLWGQPELRQRLTLQIYKTKYETKKNKLKYNFEQTTKKDKYEKKLADINSCIEIIDKDFKVPVEYCGLMNPDKKTSQGIIEMFVEPFPIEVGNKYYYFLIFIRLINF